VATSASSLTLARYAAALSWETRSLDTRAPSRRASFWCVRPQTLSCWPVARIPGPYCVTPAGRAWTKVVAARGDDLQSRHERVVRRGIREPHVRLAHELAHPFGRSRRVVLCSNFGTSGARSRLPGPLPAARADLPELLAVIAPREPVGDAADIAVAAAAARARRPPAGSSRRRWRGVIVNWSSERMRSEAVAERDQLGLRGSRSPNLESTSTPSNCRSHRDGAGACGERRRVPGLDAAGSRPARGR
jgi:hypothetical protein